MLASSTWSLLALACHIELFVQSHFDKSIAPREELCPVFKNVSMYHWKDECRHVMLDELEWTDEHAKLSVSERDQAVTDGQNPEGARAHYEGLNKTEAAGLKLHAPRWAYNGRSLQK
jgi:hypothetical protein